MSDKRTGAWMRTFGTVALGLLLVACEDTPGPVEPLGEPETTADEALLEQATMSLAGLEQEMETDVEVERERDRVTDRGRDRRPFPDRVELVVELAGSSVSLASRLIDERGATEPQLRLLDAAIEFVRKAEAALAQGDVSRAVAFSEKACWTALKAVILPRGVSEQEARMIHEVAGELLEAARAEVGDGTDHVGSVLFGWAKRFYVVGSTQLEEGNLHGVAALWKSAVISAWIVG